MTLLFSGYSGSYLYGTQGPDSDKDIRAVEIETIEYLFGLLRKEHTVFTGEKDETIYTLKFFAKLALENNPNILELIFITSKNAIAWSRDWGEFVKTARLYIPSQLVKNTFAGYAVSQLKKMETHHKWMTSNPPINPKAEDYGRKINDLGEEKWTDYQLKQKYDADKKHYEQYATWLKNRNLKRHALEEKYGFDTKNALHLFRLLFEAEDLLAFGELEFPLPYADHLKAIRNGVFHYDEVLKYSAEKLEYIKRMDSDLPMKPNFDKIQDKVIEIYRRNYEFTKIFR